MAGAIVPEGGLTVAAGVATGGGAAESGGAACVVGGTPVPDSLEGGEARGVTEAGGEAEGLLVEGDAATGGERRTGEGGTFPGALHTDALVRLPLSTP